LLFQQSGLKSQNLCFFPIDEIPIIGRQKKMGGNEKKDRQDHCDYG
jgi:hypothetical protein